jgi:hypothetical protein
MHRFGSWRCSLGAIALGLACSATAAPLGAQDAAGWSPRGWISAVSVGVPGTGDAPMPILFTVGANFTQDRPNSLALDAAVGTMPFLIAHGLPAVGARVGVALLLEVVPGLTLVPSAGASFIGMTARSNDAVASGWNAGFTFLTRDPDGSGLRIGATWHQLDYDRQPLWLIEFGVLRANRKAAAAATRTRSG